MIIQEDTYDATYQIRAYEPGKITVNETIYQKSIIIAVNQLIPDWEPQSLSQLTVAHLQMIIELKPEIVLLGTGLKFHPVSESLLQIFFQNNIGVEYMDTLAACRTFTALVSEGRQVAAGLIIGHL